LAEYRQALALKPDFAEAYMSLGTALQAQGKLTEAISAHRQALVLKPDYVDAQNELGGTLLNFGNLPEAIATFRRALALNPDAVGAHSNLLFCLHYEADIDLDALFAEHQRWGEQHAQPLAASIRAHTNVPDPERALRVGYVSPDFRQHSVAFFMEPVLRAHDHKALEVICYANVKRADVDGVTERLKGLGHGWCDIANMRDEDVAERIRADGVDILVDLTGHTDRNRLMVFARKPAPVQVTYLGYPDTIGLSAMDYRLTDAWADPPGQTERFHTEELLRLPGGFLRYRPTPDSPDVGDLPARATGHITFGSFNNAAKINARVIALWSMILQAVPSARLIMKAPHLAVFGGSRGHFQALFEQHGVAPERVEMIGRVPSSTAHLELYNRIDIGLDPFPYNGTTTTCEALWMGVPVIVLAGKTHAGRVGVSLLSNVGLPELIADTPEAYVERAVSLARDLDRLETLRRSLRRKMEQAPLTDATGFTRQLETAYREMWKRWCRDQLQVTSSK
jgi:predicted O-linked N-acetylglucosamine transferase (SPINDLY family)